MKIILLAYLFLQLIISIYKIAHKKIVVLKNCLKLLKLQAISFSFLHVDQAVCYLILFFLFLPIFHNFLFTISKICSVTLPLRHYWRLFARTVEDKDGWSWEGMPPQSIKSEIGDFKQFNEVYYQGERKTGNSIISRSISGQQKWSIFHFHLCLRDHVSCVEFNISNGNLNELIRKRNKH